MTSITISPEAQEQFDPTERSHSSWDTQDDGLLEYEMYLREHGDVDSLSYLDQAESVPARNVASSKDHALNRYARGDRRQDHATGRGKSSELSAGRHYEIMDSELRYLRRRLAQAAHVASEITIPAAEEAAEAFAGSPEEVAYLAWVDTNGLVPTTANLRYFLHSTYMSESDARSGEVVNGWLSFEDGDQATSLMDTLYLMGAAEEPDEESYDDSGYTPHDLEWKLDNRNSNYIRRQENDRIYNGNLGEDDPTDWVDPLTWAK